MIALNIFWYVTHLYSRQEELMSTYLDRVFNGHMLQYVDKFSTVSFKTKSLKSQDIFHELFYFLYGFRGGHDRWETYCKAYLTYRIYLDSFSPTGLPDL